MPFGRPVLTQRPAVAAGLREAWVTIEQLTESTGSSGFPVETWTTLARVAMAKMTARADERLMAAAPSAFSETQWHLPYRQDMDPDLVDVPKARRLVHQGRVYDIRAAAVIGRRVGIELLTLEASRVSG